MIDILSLPKKRNEIISGAAQRIAEFGLPINSLPGWEQIPLNFKLPMLKCPENRVIFSKNKIGQLSTRHIKKHEFNTSGYQVLEYNSLHDPYLKVFYSNERNLKKLRENGEITQSNDVICSLKEFNEFRQQLHNCQCDSNSNELKHVEIEHQHRLLIDNAEYITNTDCQSSGGQKNSQNVNEILLRKAYRDEQKSSHIQKLWQRTEEKLKKAQMHKASKLKALEQQKLLMQQKLKKHWDAREDLQRKQLISIKKHLQFKNYRLQKSRQLLHKNRLQVAEEKQKLIWHKHLVERMKSQEKIEKLLDVVHQQKKAFIENHKTVQREKWLHIKKAIKSRSLQNRKKTNKSLPSSSTTTTNNIKSQSCPKGQESFDKLLDEDICLALRTVFDLEDNITIPLAADDPIYKASQFIMQHILTHTHKDFSADKLAYESVCKRIECFFAEAKSFVIFRSTQIISAARNSWKVEQNNNIWRPAFNNSSNGRVSFSTMSRTIGISSYEIHPLIELNNVSDRRPTPAGSLDSIMLDSTTSLVQKIQSTHLSRNDLVFIEHYVTKFKRELIVGISRRVFAAIQCHFDKKIMNVKQQLLDIDHNFLIKQTVKSILGYSTNPLNFESILKLCISSLSSDIIWSLQKELLKIPRDPRCIKKPHIKCSCQTSLRNC